MKYQNTLLISSTLLILSACGMDGLVQEGIESSAQTSHYQSRGAPAESEQNSSGPRSKHTDVPTKTMRRSDNMRIDLQGGLLAMRVVQFKACENSLTALNGKALGEKVLNWFISSAHAHGGGGDGSLSIVDVVEPPDHEITALGDFPVPPGEYCAVTVELGNLSSLGEQEEGEDSHGLERLIGKSFVANPCYYYNTAGIPQTPLPIDSGDVLNMHECIEVSWSGPALQHDILLEEAIQVTADTASLQLSLDVLYDLWFDELNMDELSTSTEEQEKLMDNVLNAIQLSAITSNAASQND